MTQPRGTISLPGPRRGGGGGEGGGWGHCDHSRQDDLPGLLAAISNPLIDGDVHVLMPEDSGADNSGSDSLRRKCRNRF